MVNADRITLDRNIGVVTARGTRNVTPKVTTTYTLTALGFGGPGKDTRSVTVTVPGTTCRRRPKVRPRASHRRAGQCRARPTASPTSLESMLRPFMRSSPSARSRSSPARKNIRWAVFFFARRALPAARCAGHDQRAIPIQIVQTPNQVLILYEAGELFTE